MSFSQSNDDSEDCKHFGWRFYRVASIVCPLLGSGAAVVAFLSSDPDAAFWELGAAYWAAFTAVLIWAHR